MSYKVITEYKNIDTNKWSKFVENHPNGNVFQTPEMYEVYKNSKHWYPVIIIVEDGKKNIVGSLLMVIQSEHRGIVGKFSARSIVWGGPVVKDNTPSIADILIKEYINNVNDKVIYSQFRNLFDLSYFKNIYMKYGFKYEDHLTILFDLTKRNPGPCRPLVIAS